MSKVLNGQRRITPQVFQKIVTHLNLDPTIIATFDTENPSATAPALNFNNLQLEYFKVIADWYHYALIELTKVEGFKNSPEWIASRLGIPTNQAKSAIERLVKLELLEMRNGKLKPTSSGNTTLKNDFTDLAFKKMQDDLLKKAIASMWSEDLAKRDQTSICMAIHTSDMPEVKRRLTKMRRELCAYLERPQKSKPTEVYNLSLSFFSLSKEST